MRFRIKRDGWAVIVLEGYKDAEFNADDIDKLIEILTLSKEAFPVPITLATARNPDEGKLTKQPVEGEE